MRVPIFLFDFNLAAGSKNGDSHSSSFRKRFGLESGLSEPETPFT